MESESLSRTPDVVDDSVAAEVLRHLRRRQAHLVAHGSKSLEQHLRGTYDVLTAWNQPTRVCLAGLLHSGYSTDAFEHPLFRIEERRRMRRLIGEEAEHLVHTFCTINRQELFEALQMGAAIATPLRLANRRGGRAITVTQRDAGDLVVLYMANAVEQSCLPDGAPARWLAHVSELGRWAKNLAEVVPPVFDRCTGIVSSDSEDRLLEGYNGALQRLGEDLSQVLADLTAAVRGAACVAEPLIWLGVLSLAVGDVEQAAELGTQAEVLLGSWGTAWDKRLTPGKWRTLAKLLREASAGRGEANALAGDLVRGALSSSGNSPEQLYNGLQAAGLIPPVGEVAARPPSREAIALSSVLPTRFEQYVASFHSNGLPKHENYYPGITTKPWHDAQQFPLARELERAAPQIIAEFQRLDMRLFQDEGENIHRDGRWSVLFLNDHGDRKKEICDLSPVTASVIDAHAAATHLAGVSYFSCLEPGTRIAPHRGPTNMRLRCHLGIETPDQCGLRVDGIDGTWEQGRCIVFDDSFQHEAWNLSDRRRVVLIVDMWHPELTEDEVSLLKWVSA
jgi:hypothetical protein